MERAVGSNQSAIADERRAAEVAIAERDKLKADLAKFKSAADDKSAVGRQAARRRSTRSRRSSNRGWRRWAHGRRRGTGALDVSFPADKLIDANGIDVSDGGMAAIKILAEATKKEGAKVRIRARASSAAPPKELRSLFRTAGEMNAIRAARVMSSLQTPGSRPRGSPSSATRGQGRGARGARQETGRRSADRVELEIEPE